MILRIVLFLIINFTALAIGGIFTGKGVPSDWYQSLNKAPWTPPGWVFGAAWSLIMACLAIYMAYAWNIVENKKVFLGFFVVQWFLNVLWNPTFFYYHNTLLGLIIISALSLLMIAFFIAYLPDLKYKSLLLLPYIVWLLIATSLNLYIVFKN